MATEIRRGPTPSLEFLMAAPAWVGHLESRDSAGLNRNPSPPAVEMTFLWVKGDPRALETVSVRQRVSTGDGNQLLSELTGLIWAYPGDKDAQSLAVGYWLEQADGYLEIGELDSRADVSRLDGWGLHLRGFADSGGKRDPRAGSPIHRTLHVSPGPEGDVGSLLYEIEGPDQLAISTWLGPRR